MTETRDLTWLIDRRGNYRLHERAGLRRVAPRNSAEATRFVESGELLAASEALLAKIGHTIFATHVVPEEFGRLKRAVARAKGER